MILLVKDFNPFFQARYLKFFLKTIKIFDDQEAVAILWVSEEVYWVDYKRKSV